MPAADAPAGNRDSAKRTEIMDPLVALDRDRGFTIFMVTHEPDIAVFASFTISTWRWGDTVLVDTLGQSRLQTANPAGGRPLDGAVRRLIDHGPQGLNYSSMNFHVLAPSNRRARTDAMSSGSKFPRFTPCFAPGVACNGSQCVTHPQVLQ